MKIGNLILGLDNPTEDELAHLKKIQNKQLKVVLIISACVALTDFLPFLVLYFGMSFFAAEAFSAPLTPLQLFLMKAVFISWVVIGSILGFYLGSRILKRDHPGYSFRQAGRDYFGAITPKQIIEEYKKSKVSNHPVQPTSIRTAANRER